MTQTQQEIIKDIEAYEAREQELRQRLAEATSDRERAELQLMLRIKTVILFGLARKLERTINIGTAGRSLNATAGAESRA